jgi:hypothetical protein
MQVALREMQIEGGILEPLMPHEELNGAQVSAGFEQMGREAMAQRVWMNFLSQAGPRGCYTTGVPDVLSEMG